MNKNKTIVYTDGGARGNPGLAGIGVVVKDATEKTINFFSESIGFRTNNEAEYEAVIFALKKIKEMKGAEAKNTSIEIRMDSQLVARQLKGEWKIKESRLRDLSLRFSRLASNFKTINFIEIPREKNSEADALANKAMDLAQRDNPKI